MEVFAMGKPTCMVALEAPFMKMVLGTILSDLGYDVVASPASGQETIQSFTEKPADLLFIDLMMPDMEGADIILEITKSNPKAYVIVCTSLGKQKQILDALKCGAKDFVLKPFTPPVIKEVTEKALAFH
jgi:two-component system, chemotaxis family, chemotaxis protein CheY